MGRRRRRAGRRPAGSTVVRLPVPRPTCVTFGGVDYGTLYITTARAWLNEAQLAKAPLSGGLFALRPGVKGVADTPFAG